MNQPIANTPTVNCERHSHSQNLPRANLPQAQSLVAHGTHLADLVLTPSKERIALLNSIFTYLLDSLHTGSFSVINEKFDGSPAIVLGFNHKEEPFVAFKYALKGKEQALIISPDDVDKYYRKDSPLGAILRECAELLLPQLKAIGNSQYILQADLLFTPSGKQKCINAHNVILIQANQSGIQYQLQPDHSLYQSALSAGCGLVIHSCAERVLVNDRVNIRPSNVNIEHLVETNRLMSSTNVLALDPFRFNVQSNTKINFEGLIKGFILKLNTITTHTSSLSAGMVEAWNKILPYVVIYLNSELYPGKKGGLFKAAASGETFDGEKFIDGFISWIVNRQANATTPSRKSSIPKNFISNTLQPFLAMHKNEMLKLLESYYSTNVMLSAIYPFMHEALSSKLGGCQAEGIMFGEVKVVDRLSFTRKNFQGAEARKKVKKRSGLNRVDEKPLPYPFDRWRKNTIFYIGKFQPLHIGHVCAISELVKQNPTKRVVVLASNKQPNLKAKSWRELGITETRKELQQRCYKYAFNKLFRSKLLKAAFNGSVEVVFVDTINLTRYLKRAQREGMPGNIFLATGDKEVEQKRYEDLLSRYSGLVSLIPIPLKANGINATAVRSALVQAVATKQISPELEQAFSYITDEKLRSSIIAQAITAMEKVDIKVKVVLDKELKLKIKRRAKKS